MGALRFLARAAIGAARHGDRADETDLLAEGLASIRIVPFPDGRDRHLRFRGPIRKLAARTFFFFSFILTVLPFGVRFRRSFLRPLRRFLLINIKDTRVRIWKD